MLLRTLGIPTVRAGERHQGLCVWVCVCAVCRNQWKRVEEAAWQERTVGRRSAGQRGGETGAGGWQSVGRSVGSGWSGRGGREADCTRCAVRLTACALRRRPTTLLFEKGVEGDEGREGGGVEGRRVETEKRRRVKWRVWVAALTVAAIPEAPASASAARRESTEDETREKERPREGMRERAGPTGSGKERRRERR